MENHSIKTLLWDWNGTLLNDLAMCAQSINDLLIKRNLKPLSINDYKEIFTFPVRDYYTKAGFDFTSESFSKVGLEFMELYFKRVGDVDIFPDVPKILEKLKNAGIKQYVVSAMEHNFLKDTISQKGILDYFEDISGINNHYAGGKTEMAREFIKIQNIDPKTSWFIGDTLHDKEVADSLGINCILVSAGHQSHDRLNRSGAFVLNSLYEVQDFLFTNYLN
ncbi:MAG: HAD family hydrolase [Bacteroidales bacterium]|nr:HAD family hydrolase [Bacteroidales bacterium]MCF8404263.1 HAD family hydrolase [Bacteroidales bacterium]